MIEEEPLFREQALDPARCGIWSTRFGGVDVTRKFKDE